MSDSETQPLPPGRLAGVALISASVLLLQLVQTRIFSVMLWHHLTYLVVTFTMLGFAAGGTLVACRSRWMQRPSSGRLGLWCALFGVAATVSYVFVTRQAAEDEGAVHTGAGIATAALDYALLILPMVFAGMAVALALGDAGERVGRVYGVNMMGSALGCLIYVPALRALGGEGTVLLAVALSLVAAMLFARGRAAEGASRGGPALAVYGLGAAVVLGLAIFAPTALFEVPIAPSKAMTQSMALHPELEVELTVWDPLCRLDVVGNPNEPSATRTVYQDGDAPTVMPMGPAHTTANVLDKEGLAYHLFPDRAPKVLAIGIGGGIDILQAAATNRPLPEGQRVEFTGVEINPTTAGLMRGEYAERVADRYHLPGITVHVDEGRSWLRRSPELYDIIQMTGTDTYAALSSGSYVMSESYLYTAEAYDDFLGHLTDDGVISVLRFRFEPPRETLRLAAIAVDALRRDGASHPADHVLMLGITGNRIQVGGREVGIDYGCMLVRKRPFRADEVARYQAFADASPTAFLMHAPGFDRSAVADGSVAEYFDAVVAGTDEAFRDGYIYNLEPVTDDAPFFFRYHRWENVWAGLFGGEGVGETIGGAARADGGGDDYEEIVGGAPIGLIMLGTVLAESLVLVTLLVLIPLLLFKREGLAVGGAGRWVVYFMGLGAGYMLVEVAAMQRFVLFLGHPGYAITVVLLTFLLFSGAGAAYAGKSDDPRRTLRRALLGVLVLIALLVAGLPFFFDATLRLALTWRVVLTVVVLAPLAFVMGQPFPSGLALVSRKAAPLVPWAFGVNGGASVLASVAGILVAMGGGFSWAFAVAAGCYAVAWLVGASAGRTAAA